MKIVDFFVNSGGGATNSLCGMFIMLHIVRRIPGVAIYE